MNESAISVRYAKALFQAAEEKGVKDKVLSDLHTLESFFLQIPEFPIFIESPVVRGSEKLKFFKEITAAGFDELTRNFLLLITENKREVYIKGMIRNFYRLYRKAEGIVEAVLITPQEIAESTIDQIRNLLNETYKATVEIRKEQDEALIGGFVLRVEDQQLDASIASQLLKIRREMDSTML